MEIRVADLADLNQCIQLDGSFSTEFVWQMQKRGDVNKEMEALTVSFQTIRLPRSVQVPYPRPSDELVGHWQGVGCFLVAAQEDKVKGFVDVQPITWNETAHVTNLIVDPKERRKGIGAILLEAAADWARSYGLRYMILEAQTKNVPAIHFYQKNGGRFCSFNDYYYPNRDVAVFFSCPV
ncbi:MAG: GNAT family N-acetyltransferase [Chloroflexi bacterium]|nr:GNAT family N-acetyltransferase [Chloroflexota bacterium]